MDTKSNSHRIGPFFNPIFSKCLPVSMQCVMYPSPIGPSHLATGRGGGEGQVCTMYVTCNMVRPIWQQDVGAEKGKYYAVNFPLRDGVDDESYEMIFKPVMAKVCSFLLLHSLSLSPSSFFPRQYCYLKHLLYKGGSIYKYSRMPVQWASMY